LRVPVETDRLLLRPFTTADVDHLVELDSDPEVMRFLNGGIPTPREMVEQRILPAFLGEYARSGGFGVWAAIEKASGEFVGWFAFHPPEGGNRADVTLGYRLRRSAWGRGYATEGARALIREGFAELGVRRVTATTYQDNLASRRVMEKLGMKLVRRYRLTAEDLANETHHVTDPENLWAGDDLEYALLASDWEG
jgi:RimJ/RimL family protein N-acetyltransferase